MAISELTVQHEKWGMTIALTGTPTSLGLNIETGAVIGKKEKEKYKIKTQAHLLQTD